MGCILAVHSRGTGCSVSFANLSVEIIGVQEAHHPWMAAQSLDFQDLLRQRNSLHAPRALGGQVLFDVSWNPATRSSP